MTAIHNRKPADTSALARPLRLQETIAELILEAMTFCVESKVEETVRKWLINADIAPDDPRLLTRAVRRHPTSSCGRPAAIFPHSTSTPPSSIILTEFVRWSEQDECRSQAS